jgi:hypothetical protein
MFQFHCATYLFFFEICALEVATNASNNWNQNYPLILLQKYNFLSFYLLNPRIKPYESKS